MVSEVGGTTTDPVRKNFEIPGFAPVVWIDTAGIDDDSPLGGMRLKKTMETLEEVDLAMIVFREWEEAEKSFAAELSGRGIPMVCVRNEEGFQPREQIIKDIKASIPASALRKPSMFGERVCRGDTVLLVCPVDSGAPAGRLILPQVQAIRELLDGRAVVVVVQPSELEDVFKSGLNPSLVVTDSQVFAQVREVIPPEIELTSFSILLAAAKGDAEEYRKGLDKVDRLQEGDRVLIVENCLHHPGCEDIGRVKIPGWLEKYTEKRLRFEFVSGTSPLPEDLKDFALMVQCGGCMASSNRIRSRIKRAVGAGVPTTNYGMLIRKVTEK